MNIVFAKMLSVILCVSSLSGCSFNSNAEKLNTNLLITALTEYNLEAVREAIDSGLNLNETDNAFYKYNPILYAMEYPYMELIECLLKEGADPNYANAEGVTLLMYAAGIGLGEIPSHPEFTPLLLKYNAEVDLKDDKGWTALDYATERRNVEDIELLLEHGAKATETTLEIALLGEDCYVNSLKTVRILMESFDQKLITKVDPILLEAIKGNSENVVELLDSKVEANRISLKCIGAFVAFCNDDVLRYMFKNLDLSIIKEISEETQYDLLRTASGMNNEKTLHYLKNIWEYDKYLILESAINNKAHDVMQYILEDDIDILPNNAFNFMKDVTFTGDVKAASLLFKYGYPLDDQNAMFDNISTAIVEGHWKLVKYFYESGAVTFNNVDEISSLFKIACAKGDLKIVKFLLKINKALLESIACVNEAAGSRSDETVAYLLELGADPNECIRYEDGSYQDSALSEAIKCGHLDMVKNLLENGADPNLVLDSGKTAIFAAVEEPSYRIVQCLIDYGADINFKNKDGKTPLEYMKSKYVVAPPQTYKILQKASIKD